MDDGAVVMMMTMMMSTMTVALMAMMTTMTKKSDNLSTAFMSMQYLFLTGQKLVERIC